MTVRSRAIVASAVGLLLMAPAGAEAAPVASFTYSPASPLTGEVVTFTSTSSEATSLAWDLDGEGPPCDDATGPVTQRSFSVAGSYAVWLCVDDNVALAKQTVVVRNRPPVASFAFAPDAPVTDEAVLLGSTSVDPDGPIVTQTWDLDGDGAFDDATGATAAVSFEAAGSHPVSLFVTDRDGASSTASMSIRVVKPPPPPLSPFPLVRMAGRFGEAGTTIEAFVVRAPRGAKVTVKCLGGGCPYRLRRARVRKKRLRFHSLERRLRPDTTIEVFIRKPERVGKYIRFRIRRGREPARLDRCLRPGLKRPVACPRT